MTAIDWTQPIETTETPPRPVRVLATDIAGIYPVVGIIPDSTGSDFVWRFTADGRTTTTRQLVEGEVRLRNVAAKPVRHVVRVGLRKNRHGDWIADASPDEDIQQYRHIAVFSWMNDGSPVRGELPALASDYQKEIDALKAELQRTVNILDEVTRERDRWKEQSYEWTAKAAECALERDRMRTRDTALEVMHHEHGLEVVGLMAEIARMKPVVDAAVVWERHFSPLAGDRLVGAVRTYRGKSAIDYGVDLPREPDALDTLRTTLNADADDPEPLGPVKSCKTCIACDALTPHSPYCLQCASEGYSKWEALPIHLLHRRRLGSDGAGAAGVRVRYPCRPRNPS